MVAAPVAVAGQFAALAGGGVLEEFEVGDRAQAQHRDPRGSVAVDAELAGHPVALLVLHRAYPVKELGSQDLDEEVHRLVQVGHGEGDVVDGERTGDAGHEVTPFSEAYCWLAMALIRLSPPSTVRVIPVV